MCAPRTAGLSMPGFESLLTERVLAERYRIGEVIGRGGMGAVYRATDERLGREVAVKVMLLGVGDTEARERLRVRFHREARAAARLHHPNVVTVHDFGTDPALGLDYLVMQFLHGEDLATMLERSGPPPVPEAIEILQQAARGLAAGHRAGLIHRDVKPGNLFVTRGEDGLRVFVLDFGIARLDATDEDATATSLTQHGQAPLSRAYAAPEQLRADACVTPACDVWALGATAFQLLLGRKPFNEADTNRMSAGHPVPVPPMRAYRPEIPPEAEEAVQRALAWDPAERLPDAAAFAQALAGVPVAPAHEPEATAPVRSRWARRLPWRRVAAIGGVVLLGVGGVELYERMSEPSGPVHVPKPRWEVVRAEADYTCSALLELCVRVRCTIANVGDAPGDVAVQATLRGGPSPVRKTERAFLRPKDEKTVRLDFPEARLGESYEQECRARTP